MYIYIYIYIYIYVYIYILLKIERYLTNVSDNCFIAPNSHETSQNTWNMVNVYTEIQAPFVR